MLSSCLFEEYINLRKQFSSLQMENNELKEQLWGAKPSCNNCGHTDCENYQMQRKSESCVRWISYKDQLIKAKGLIKGLLDILDLVEDRTSEHTVLIGEAENFLY